MSTDELFFALLAYEVGGDALSEEQMDALTPECLEQVCALSCRYDLAHLIADALRRLAVPVPEHLHKKLEHERNKAFFRSAKLLYESEVLFGALVRSAIPFLPLKGMVMCCYYPEPWMRTSCDIDVYVCEGDVERASLVLTDQLGYERGLKSAHDIPFISPRGVRIELHYVMLEQDVVFADDVLQDVFAHCTSGDDGYHMYLGDPYFYFHHIGHMAKHFTKGGCGVRPFLDLWLLLRRPEFDRAACDALLERGGLVLFERCVVQLCEVWFSGAEHTALTRQIQDFLLSGGLYGDKDNYLVVSQRKKGGKLSYALSRIFMPYDKLIFLFPVLERHRWLTPFCEVARWFIILFDGRARSGFTELRMNSAQSAAHRKSVSDLFAQIGL